MENVAQVAGVDAMGLISMIAKAARNAATHRRNCEQLAGHVAIIGNLLEKLSSTELRRFPETGEPLDGLEDALKNALDLVESCRERSYLYLLAMGWSVVYQFRRAQAEIDRYLKLLPLISLVHQYRIKNLKESLQAVEEDHREYDLDDGDVEAHKVILKRDRTKKDSDILEKSLSRRYPDLRFHEALQEEKEKLHVELHRSKMNNDPNECHVIENLIEITENVVNALPENKLILNADAYVGSGCETITKSACGLQPPGQLKSEWQSDLFDCCGEPHLSLKTCFYPCGTFTWIAHTISKGEIYISSALVTFTEKFLMKLRKNFNIEGGSCDDFLTHLMCCCCAMVQEWRELDSRDFNGCQRRKMIPPPYQYMKP
ncbi:cell number regulator 13-like isoform X3 [Malania oleifera]|uniref:cell number regulator 13-like isoform X3 n=1 Tax=Malania oleifera TaxID=397392 RepID=UPI0025AEC33E|nr:cell number regulator 13-like isoform X3 [Malania oleifera]